jgi:hypothetical protein
MANRLTDLDVAEVSLVRKPANKRAFLIYKQLEGGESLMADLNGKILETLARDFPAELEEKITMQNELDEEAREVVKNVVQLLRAYKQELPEDILETVAELAELKLPEPVVDQDEPPKEEEEKVEIMAGFPRPVKKADGSYDLSNVPKEQRAIIEALWKQAERSEMLAKELREEKQRRIKKEFEERAREFENLPISAEELGQILQVFHAKAKDEFEKIEGLLRAVNEALGQSELFKEMGSSFNGPAGGAWSKVEKMAESLIQKDVSLTKEKAVALVLERNPDLYKQYLAEQQK